MLSPIAALVVLVATTEPAEPPAGEPAPLASQGSARLRVHGDRVDRDAVLRGLELRVGSRWERWTIDVEEISETEVSLRLRDDAGRVHTRELTLAAETTEGRSRELASALALLVDQLEATEASAPEPIPEPAPEPPAAPRPSGWVGLGPRVALDPRAPVDVDAGASLAGGTWLVGEHLQPLAELAWARSTAGTLTVDALRMGGGLLGGMAAPAGRLWWGGGALVRAQWARARASGSAEGWWTSPAVVASLQLRLGPMVLGAMVGVDLLVRPLRARGDGDELRWGAVRPMAALHLGLRLPPRPARRTSQ
ncbi:MAG: hypothetical protein KC501_20640 [Myxococcales bacterium]|nr:hypothetical protein [Myxococcales bacterium]